jgi:hemerythrin-like domain-containing protein/uncharacterized protein (DUF2249 family)
MSHDDTVRIDLRAMDPAAARGAFTSAFEALASGAALSIDCADDTGGLLDWLESSHHGGFDWNVLEAEPEQHRIEVRRRAIPGPRATTEYLEGDHDRLDALLLEARRLADAGSFERARALFREFRCGLSRHIEIEEQVLFPTFERLTGIAAGPTRVMRMEHVEIRVLMETLAAAFDSDDERTGARVDALVAVLSEHNMKEERMLYPMTDDALGTEAAKDELVSKMFALRT